MAMKFWHVIILGVVALTGCGELGYLLDVRNHRGEYEEWINLHRNYLVTIPESSVESIEFSTITDTSGTIRPIFDFNIKAGDWDGILNVTLVLDIDGELDVKGIHEERFTFIALPPSTPEPDRLEKGRMRHFYKGLELPVSSAKDLIEAAVRGRDFDDLRERSYREGKTVLSCFVDTDDRKDLRPGVLPNVEAKETDETPRKRRIMLLPP